MRTWVVPLLVSLTTIAGCLGGDGTDDGGQDVLPAPADPLDAVHHIAGEVPALLEGATQAATGTYYDLGVETLEPTVGATSTGGVFMTVLKGFGTSIYRTMDKGQTWEDMGPYTSGEVNQVPNTNDPYLYVDPWTDRLIKFDMHALTCMSFEYSDDDGETWSVVTPACGLPPAAQDHQSLASAPAPDGVTTVGYPNVLVYCVNRGPNVAGSWCSSSFDGGLAWTPLAPGFPAATPQCLGVHGHMVGDSDGLILRPGVGCGDMPTVWISGDGGITWSENPIGGETGVFGHDVGVAADEANNLHAFWIGDDRMPYYATSIDHGATWTAPVNVAPPGVTAIALPAVAAGAEGRAAWTYIATTDALEVDDGGGLSPEGNISWSGMIGFTTDGLSEQVAVSTVAVNMPDDALDISNRDCGSARCGGFVDFIDIAIDAEGRPWAAFSHNRKVCPDSPFLPCEGEDFGIMGTLTQGPPLRGEMDALEVLTPGKPITGGDAEG